MTVTVTASATYLLMGNYFVDVQMCSPPIVGLADSPRATMLRNGPTYRDSVIDPEYRLAVSIWSDDFEPRNYSKLNKYQKANIYFTCVVESIVINVS